MLGVLHVDTMKGWRGGERQAYYLCRGLKERGMEVGFACRPGSELHKALATDGVRVHPVAFRCEADFTAAWRMAGLIRRHDYDVVHMHDSHAHWLGACAARFAGMPLRVVSRRVDFSIRRHGFGLSIVKYRCFSDAYIAVSGAVKASLVRDGVPGEMISVVHSGVNLSAPGNGSERRLLEKVLGVAGTARFVGSVGSLVAHKGHRHFVDAAPEILREESGARFVVFGEGELRGELEARVRRMGLSGKFFLPGHHPGASALLKGFDVFVMPSVQEGLGTSLLDAMAAGVPVVAARAGGIPEVVDDGRTGLLVPPADPLSLAAAVKRLLSEPELGCRLARAAGEKVASQFTVEGMVEKTVGVYNSFLGRR